ncbi:MAG: glycogen debranching protein GlgX [Thermodesulfobacteriota bacterium]
MQAKKSPEAAAPVFPTSAGLPLPLGPTLRPEGVNFALFSRHAQTVSLVLFRSGHEEPVAEIPLDPNLNRTGDIWHILIHGYDTSLRYGYRLTGPFDPWGEGHWFKSEHLLIDPYAKALTGGSDWGVPYCRSGLCGPLSTFQRRGCIVDNNFDWEGDRPLNIPLQESVIYELHVRGFTRHDSSGVSHPGTYQGVVEKIPYLKQLGVTAVELLPVFEFNEHETTNRNPFTKERLLNFWGYSPLSFMAPKAAYAVNGRNGNQVREFKQMVKALHRAGIEVILDVVFNHTAEGGANGPVISLRGLDNSIYYLLDPRTRDFLNFSGCGNTVNCNHPLVRHLIMDCLRYWVMEMHVDGFRFDLASVLGRDQQGNVLPNPPMVEKIAEDPILARTKIIAEAWDAAGLYQVGHFSTNKRWAEWNGRFRDDVRRFLCAEPGSVADLATRIAGSADLYEANGRRPSNSINFVTSHDGFTLYDQVSYNQKHNQANGEENRDGCDHNISWNSGVEGEASDPAVQALRMRRIRTFAVLLLLSQGVPMLVAGDEFGRSQFGNNNAYCQDNEISWLDWRLAEKNRDLLRFFSELITIRKAHRLFHRTTFFAPAVEGEQPEVEWYAETPGQQDWSPERLTLACLLHGVRPGGVRIDDDFLLLLNGGHQTARFTLPPPAEGRGWRRLVDTGAKAPRDIMHEKTAPTIKATRLTVAAMGAVVLVSKPEGKAT